MSRALFLRHLLNFSIWYTWVKIVTIRQPTATKEWTLSSLLLRLLRKVVNLQKLTWSPLFKYVLNTQYRCLESLAYQIRQEMCCTWPQASRGAFIYYEKVAGMVRMTKHEFIRFSNLRKNQKIKPVKAINWYKVIPFWKI